MRSAQSSHEKRKAMEAPATIIAIQNTPEPLKPSHLLLSAPMPRPMMPPACSPDPWAAAADPTSCFCAIADVQAIDPALLDATGWDPSLLKTDDPPADFGDPESRITGMTFEIVVSCDDEDQQRALLEAFEADGLACKAVVI